MVQWKLREGDLKRYPHFDQILSPSEIISIVSNPRRVEQNAFFPLLQYTKTWQPFRGKAESTEAKPKPKDRPIRYATRRDSYVFSYYRHLLSSLYEQELQRLGINGCPIAYRRIATSTDSRRGKCNINFAKEAFDKIKEIGECCAIAVDISSYFESIDHARLKALWCRLLRVEELPGDHFAVFKNITSYRYIERLEAYRRLGFYGQKRTTKSGKPINGYLIPYNKVPKQLCSPHEFRQKILGKNGKCPSLIQRNKIHTVFHRVHRSLIFLQIYTFLILTLK